MNKSRLQKMYVDFWLHYSGALRGVSFAPIETNSPFRVEELTSTTFKISIRLDINRLGLKTKGSKRNITVRIVGSTECVFAANDDAKITKSNVTVNYLEVDEVGQEAVLVTSLHYDYEVDIGSLRNHPIYHCQFASDAVGDENIMGRRFVIHSSSEVRRERVHKEIRIPTANMDMISVLLCVAADHCEVQDFQGVLTIFDAHQWHERLPHISHRSFSPGTNLRSRAWYVP